MQTQHKISVIGDGVTISLEYGSCRAYLNGELAGTIELPIFCKSEHAENVAKHLSIHVQGYTGSLGAASLRLEGESLILTWQRGALAQASTMPRRVDLYWGGEEIGSALCG